MIDRALDNLIKHGPDSNYQRWFGTPTPENVQHVIQVLSNIQHALAHDQNTLYASPSASPRELAHVYPDSPNRIALTPHAFEHWGGPNSLEKTLIHELSHFTRIGATADRSYGARDDLGLAARNGRAAVTNADNYGLYVGSAGVASNNWRDVLRRQITHSPQASLI